MSADELVDVVDQNDVVIAQASRREVRRNTLRHRCVYIVVRSADGKLLIHRRTDTKDIYPGFWDVTFGGVLGAGEAYDAAAARELEEECGLCVSLQRLFPIAYEDSTNRVCGVVYDCVAAGALRLQADEVSTVEWVELGALPDLLAARQFCPDGLAVLRRYLDTVRQAPTHWL